MDMQGKVIQRILNNWETLIECFTWILPELKQDHEFKAEVILETMHNKQIKGLMAFILPK